MSRSVHQGLAWAIGAPVTIHHPGALDYRGQSYHWSTWIDHLDVCGGQLIATLATGQRIMESGQVFAGRHEMHASLAEGPRRGWGLKLI
jgi:DNA-directed RNA polymerase